MQDAIAWIIAGVLGPLVTLYIGYRWRMAKTARVEADNAKVLAENKRLEAETARFEAETAQAAAEAEQAKTEAQLKQTQDAHDYMYAQFKEMIEELKKSNKTVVRKSDELEHKIDAMHREHSTCREDLARVSAESKAAREANAAMAAEISMLRGRVTTIENGGN